MTKKAVVKKEKKVKVTAKKTEIRYGFGRTSQGSKVVHFLMLSPTSDKKGILVCQFGKNNKEFDTNPNLDPSHVTCKNCLRSESFKGVKEAFELAQAEAKKKSKSDAKAAQKRREDDAKRKEVAEKEITNMPEDSVLMYYAANKSGEPIITVIAENTEKESIDIAKERIVAELQKSKSKFNRWNKAGKVILSKYIPVAEISDYVKTENYQIRDTMKGSGEQLFSLLGAILKELREINRNTSFTAKNTRSTGGNRLIVPRSQGPKKFDHHNHTYKGQEQKRRVIPRR